jgi:hypothetical protein
LPLPNLAETFSNNGFSPNWIVIFAVVSNVGTPVYVQLLLPYVLQISNVHTAKIRRVLFHKNQIIAKATMVLFYTLCFYL